MLTQIQPTCIITGHSSADFDALASMVAAQKLYPEGVLIAPTLLPRQRSHRFYTSIPETFGFINPKDCDFSKVQTVIVVDAHSKSRFEHIAEVFTRKNIKIISYDHHPDSEDDLPLDERTIRMAGSTTTIITKLLQGKKITLTKDEATLFGLGIYEDTGSFTYSNTTTEDLEAAAYLLGFGMNLVTIAELTSPDLTREQIHLLDLLFRGASTHNIQGVEITISEVTLDYYFNDFAEIVKIFMEVAHLNAVIVLAVMGDKVHMIGRSELEDIDVGAICAAFAGGGHPKAASATIKDIPVAEVKAQLIGLLVVRITPTIIIERHMSSPAKSVTSSTHIARAEEIMSRYGLKSMPVVDEISQKCVGIFDLQTASRAVAHKIGDLPVRDYMQRNIRTLTTRDTLLSAVEIIIKQNQRLVPIVEDEHIVGVLTRTDVIKLFINKSLHLPEIVSQDQDTKERSIASQLSEHLPKEIFQTLQEVGELGDQLGISVFAVGGFVRDLLLRRPNLDVDIAVEGDSLQFATALTEKLNGKLRVHNKFKTAVITYLDKKGQKQHLDVATSRLEYYDQPAALPIVELSSIKIDLYRRDFTINALAIQLNKKHFGTLIDPFGAQKDIREKSISVLHSLSLIEDPTRILRAVRFERRFAFKISNNTERLIKNALTLGILGKLSGVRLFNELVHICDESDVPSCFRRMDQWGMLESIHPILKINPKKDVLLNSCNEAISWYKLLYKDDKIRNWVVYLLGFCINAKYPDVKELLHRLGLIVPLAKEFSTTRENTRKAFNMIAEAQKAKQDQGLGQTDLPMSLIYNILSPITTEGLLFMLAHQGQDNPTGKYISLYFTRLRDVKISITGQDIKNLGYQPSELFKKALNHVHEALLDGKVTTKEEQILLASSHMSILTEGEDEAEKNITEVLNGRR